MLPAPRLKDVTGLDTKQLNRLYWELILIVRRMYQTCHLVHADLSEYNLLYHDGHIVVMDWRMMH